MLDLRKTYDSSIPKKENCIKY